MVSALRVAWVNLQEVGFPQVFGFSRHNVTSARSSCDKLTGSFFADDIHLTKTQIDSLNSKIILMSDV